MDTSDEYILMASKAIELKYLWKEYEGDFYNYKRWWNNDNTIMEDEIEIIFYCDDDYYSKYPAHQSWSDVDKYEVTWLPRQDQLQDMIPPEEPNFSATAWGFYHFWNVGFSSINPDYPDYFKSMEQLWLAYVMFKLVHKQWNGTEWILIE